MDRHHAQAPFANSGVDRVTCIVTLMTLCLLIVYAIYTVVRRASKGGVETAAAGADCGFRHGSRDEPVAPPVNSERFSMARARAYVESVATVPEDFKKYKFDVTQSTGVYGDWNKDTNALSAMCGMLIKGLAYVIRHGGLCETPAAGREAEDTTARLVLAVTENFIIRFKTRLESFASPRSVPPWGSEPVPFVCDIAAMLAHYLLLEQGASMRDEAVELICALITSPTDVLGVKTTDRLDTVRLVAPWIVATYIKDTADSAVKSTGYAMATKNAKVSVCHAIDAQGTHMDHSFYNGRRVDYGYLARLCDAKIKFYYGFDTKLGLVQTPLLEWAAVKSVILHPTVKCGNVGLLSGAKTLSCDANESSKYGIEVMPFSGYIRYFTKDRQFSVRAQKKHLAYYVVDKTVSDMAQYWVQYRNVHDGKSAATVKFPDVGFINKSSQSALTKMTLATGTGVTEYTPKSAKSFVAAYKHLGVMYQEYEIEDFGKFVVSELIVINTTTQTVTVNVRIVNSEAEELTYYGASATKHVVPAKATKSFVTTMNMTSGVVETKALSAFPDFPYTLDNGVVVKEVANMKSYLVFDNNVPVVWMPYDWTYELPNLVYNADSVQETFKFDTTANQYVNVKKHA